MDRAAWSDGLGIADDERQARRRRCSSGSAARRATTTARRRSRAPRRSSCKQAGVDFAILGQEESCTGDPARRAGNEFLFATLAEAQRGDAQRLQGAGRREDGRHDVPALLQHAEERVPRLRPEARGRAPHRLPARPPRRGEARADERPSRGASSTTTAATSAATTASTIRRARSCRRIPGVELVEPEYWTKQRGLCCGAGGAQMWMEEQNKDRVNVKRTLQLARHRARTTIASACPFCMTMLTDGLKSKNLEEQVQQLDVAELLEQSCAQVREPAARSRAVPLLLRAAGSADAGSRRVSDRPGEAEPIAAAVSYAAPAMMHAHDCLDGPCRPRARRGAARARGAGAGAAGPRYPG